MSSPPSSSRVHGRGCGSGQAPQVSIFHFPLNADMEHKMQWCMEIFHTIDKILIDFILMTHPQVQKQDARLNMVEEKIKILTGLFNELRMSGGTLSIGSRSFHLEQHLQLGVVGVPSMNFGDLFTHNSQDFNRSLAHLTQEVLQQHDADMIMGKSGHEAGLATDAQAWFLHQIISSPFDFIIIVHVILDAFCMGWLSTMFITLLVLHSSFVVVHSYKLNIDFSSKARYSPNFGLSMYCFQIYRVY